MKINHHIKMFSVFILSFLLSGCVLSEYVKFKIDLKTKNVEIEYINIVSTIEKEDKYWKNEKEKNEFFEMLKATREIDLNELLEDYNNTSENSGKKNISKKLFKKNGKLNGIEKFKFADFDELDLSINADSTKYIMKFNDMEKYISGNGNYIKTDTGDYIYWDINVKKLEAYIQLYDLNKDFDYTESLLPYWQKWKNKK
ncbi:MAG: hypothetical protein KAT68_11955 [Bacteroidales bacterium]|nr:hypothetical protein [Bacteroidales bacterium]